MPRSVMGTRQTADFVHALSNAHDYGYSVPFWVGIGDSKQAARRARYAARWAYKALAINPSYRPSKAR